jgi:hypothetical protein
MYNPLLADPSELKDLDLDAKILDLSRKYSVAARMNQTGVVAQIITALDVYKSEQMRRQYVAVRNLVNRNDKGLDDLINID